jgi:outer membrane protein assembly factor BamB
MRVPVLLSNPQERSLASALFATLYLVLCCTVPALADPGGAPVTIAAETLWQTDLVQAGKGSPRAADLTGDGLDDVVLGVGLEESWGKVVALDGATGAILWSRPMPDEVLVATPFLDIDDDEVPDVFISGRKKLTDVYALSGKDGSTLWRLTQANPGTTFPPINFINLLLVDDRDDDGHRDLLVVQSGGIDARRLAARFHWVSSKNGTLLRTGYSPDGKECYALPLFESRPEAPGRFYVGTGGETLSGSLFKLGYPSLQKEWRIRAIGGGFIGSPLLTDLDFDGSDEVVAAGMDGTVYRVDAGSGEVSWRWRDRPYWTYVSPAVGSFGGDESLDVVAGFNRGAWPSRDSARLIWLDGATGDLLSELSFDERGRSTASSPLVLDVDRDGRDETLIVLSNPIPDFTVKDESHQILLFDGRDDRRVLLQLDLDGYSIATPRLADLDGNGKLDLIHTSHYGVMRFELTVSGVKGKPQAPLTHWNELRGPNGEGIYRRSR